MHFHLFLLFTFFSSSIILASLIPEADFVHLDSYEEHKFELFKHENVSEGYFTFNNPNKEGDLVVHFAKGKGFTSSMYIYSNIDDIKQNENKEYIDYLYKETINKNIFSYPSFNSDKVYIIIKEEYGFYFDDYIMIYNELEEIKLDNNIPYVVYKFFSHNAYTMKFEGETNEIINLDIINENKENQLSIEIYLNESLIEKKDIVDLHIILNEEKSLKGTYSLHISKTNKDSEIDNEKINIIMNKNKLYEIAETNDIKVNYINSNKLFFYTDISSFDLNEEGIVSIELPVASIVNNHLTFVSAIIVPTTSLSEEELLPLMPQTKEDNKLLLVSSLDNIYQIYYQRPKTEEGEKCVILLTVQLDTNEKYFSPLNVKASITQRKKKITVSSLNIHQTQEFKLKNYIPYLIEVSIPKTNENMSYIFYSNEPLVMNYHNGTMIEQTKKDNLTKHINNQIAIFNKNIKAASFNTIIFKFYGQEQNIVFHYETTSSDIIYFDKRRPAKTITNQLINCNQPFYIFGSYQQPKVSNYYFEEVYGSFNLTYKGYEDFQDDSSQNKSIFIIDQPKEQYGHFEEQIDIFKIQCTRPGYLNLHLFEFMLPVQLKENSLYTLLLEDFEKEMLIENAKDTMIEFITPYGKETIIQVEDKTLTLSKDKKKDSIVVSSGKTLITVSSKEKGNVIQIKTSSEMNYNIFEESTFKTNEKNIIYAFNNSQLYKEIKVTILNEKSSYSDNYYYYLGRSSKENLKYLPLLQNCNLDKNTFNTKNELSFTNPYDKYPQSSLYSNDDLYYIAFQFNKELNRQFTFTYIQKEIIPDVIKKETVTTITSKEAKLFIEKGKDDSDLNIIAKKCGSQEANYDFIFSYYDSIISKVNMNKPIQILSQTNSNIDLIMNVKNNVEERDMKYNGLQLSYFYKNNINKDEIETKIQQKHSIQLKEGTTIQWEKVSDISYYEIFIFNDNATDLEYVDNDCYLSSISNSTSNKNNQDYIYYKISNQSIDSFDIEREGNFTVNIVGVIEAEIPMRLVYGAVKIETKTNKTNNRNIWKYVLIGVGSVILISICVFIIIKCRKPKMLIIPEATDALVRDTSTSEMNDSTTSN